MPLSSLRTRIYVLLAALFALCVLGGCGHSESSSSASDAALDTTSSSTSNALAKLDSEVLQNIITFNAPTITRGENDLLLLIFGAEHCRSCEQLLSSIAANPTLQNALVTDMKAYYINADREENIAIITPKAAQASQNISESSPDSETIPESTPAMPTASPHHAHPSYKTSELVALYGVRGTPLLVFLSPSGKKLLGYPGFISTERLLLTLTYLKDSHHWEKSERDIAQDLMKLYQDSKLSH